MSNFFLCLQKIPQLLRFRPEKILFGFLRLVLFVIVFYTIIRKVFSFQYAFSWRLRIVFFGFFYCLLFASFIFFWKDHWFILHATTRQFLIFCNIFTTVVLYVIFPHVYMGWSHWRPLSTLLFLLLLLLYQIITKLSFL